MKAKKIISILLTAVSFLSLTACGGNEALPAQSDSPSDSSESAPQGSLGTDKDSSENPPESSAADPAETSDTSGISVTSPSSVPNDTTSPGIAPVSGDGEISGSELILDSGRSIMLSGTNSENGKSYAASVNKYKEKFPNINIYSLIIPTAISFYLPEKFKSYDPNEKAHIDEINAQLKDVIPVDVYSVLAQHTEEPVYFLTDHHWTQLGAFYGAEEFAKTAGVDFKPLTEFDKREAGEFVGSAYGNSGKDPKILELAEPFTYYIPKSNFSTTFYELDGSGGIPFAYFENPNEFDKFGMYSLYMYGDGHIVHLNTDCKNGRKLLIIKEAFANPFACNLVNSFEDIWIADMKYMKTTATKLINDNGITDLLFCLSTFSTSGVNQEFISKVM